METLPTNLEEALQVKAYNRFGLCYYMDIQQVQMWYRNGHKKAYIIVIILKYGSCEIAI